MEFYCEASDTRITLLPDDTYSINTMVAYDSPYLAMQFASYSEASTDFAKEIAPCRTFVFLREVEMLLANNLIKGGDLSNAIVIVDRKMDQPEIDRLAKLFGYGNIQIKEGVLNNLELYFDNEPARHKLLDVIGDLALCGRFIKGRVIAERPGHKANTSMAKMIYKEILAEEKDDAYPIDLDLDATPLMDINKIRTLLPHRPPFLLVDKIYKVTENMVIGCKNVTMNEPHFVGHFPDEPVMPGVLIIEALAQVGAVAILSLDENKGKIAFFGGINKCRFKGKVKPGDKLRLETKIIRHKGPMGVGEAVASVDGKVVAQAELTFMVGAAQ